MIQETILTSNTATRADFNKNEFDRLIIEKGRPILHEKALVCPCKGAVSNALSNCKNCGGTGWVFVNPKETRMVFQGLDAVSKQEGWSEEMRGMARITASAEDKISFMDRLTLLDDSLSTYGESLHFRKVASTIFAYTAYNIVHIDLIAMFDGIDAPLVNLIEGEDYTIVNNTIRLDSDKYEDANVDDLSITLRYQHHPQFHIIEHKRDTIQSYKLVSAGVEQQQILPLSAYARRAHYQLAALNLNGDNLITNQLTEL